MRIVILAIMLLISTSASAEDALQIKTRDSTNVAVDMDYAVRQAPKGFVYAINTKDPMVKKPGDAPTRVHLKEWKTCVSNNCSSMEKFPVGMDFSIAPFLEHGHKFTQIKTNSGHVKSGTKAIAFSPYTVGYVKPSGMEDIVLGRYDGVSERSGDGKLVSQYSEEFFVRNFDYYLNTSDYGNGGDISIPENGAYIVDVGEVRQDIPNGAVISFMASDIGQLPGDLPNPMILLDSRKKEWKRVANYDQTGKAVSMIIPDMKGFQNTSIQSSPNLSPFTRIFAHQYETKYEMSAIFTGSSDSFSPLPEKPVVSGGATYTPILSGRIVSYRNHPANLFQKVEYYQFSNSREYSKIFVGETESSHGDSVFDPVEPIGKTSGKIPVGAILMAPGSGMIESPAGWINCTGSSDSKCNNMSSKFLASFNERDKYNAIQKMFTHSHASFMEIGGTSSISIDANNLMHNGDIYYEPRTNGEYFGKNILERMQYFIKTSER